MTTFSPVRFVSSPDNAKLRWLRRLAESRGRRRQAVQLANRMGRPLQEDEDLLLLEGPHLVEAAVTARVELVQAFLSEAPNSAVRVLQSRLESMEVVPERFQLPDELLHSAVEAETSQGICALAVVTRKPLLSPADPRARVGAVWLDQLRDPGNIGAVLRVAEAAGVRSVGISAASSSWRHPRALRASAGSALRLGLRDELEFDAFRKEAEEAFGAPLRWVGLSAQGDSLSAVPLEVPLGIAMGSESHGLSRTVEEQCDDLAAIEMTAPVESLNVAVAAGIALYQLKESLRDSPGAVNE